MRIGGWQKVSFIDYPGKIAAVIFTQGCNFRCPFCHNRELVIPSFFKENIDMDEIMGFLKERVGKIQGVVITGGEPTLQEDLLPFLRAIKETGYLVKLDTNGSRPRVLKELMRQGLVDFIAMDIKAPLERYDELAGVAVNKEHIRESIRLILDSGLAHQFRTTAVKPLASLDDFERIKQLIAGSERYILQEFVPQPTIIDTTLLDKGHFTPEELSTLQKEGAGV